MPELVLSGPLDQEIDVSVNGEARAYKFPGVEKGASAGTRAYTMQNIINDDFLGTSLTTSREDAAGKDRWDMNLPTHFVTSSQGVHTTHDGQDRAYASFNGRRWFEGTVVGGTAYIYEIRNERMNLIRQSEVVGANWDFTENISGNRAILGTSYEHKIRSRATDGYTFWFQVAAVDSQGRVGPWSGPETWTPSSTDGGTEGGDESRSSVSVDIDADSPDLNEAPSNFQISQNGNEASLLFTWEEVSQENSGYVLRWCFRNPNDLPTPNRYVDLAPATGSEPTTIPAGCMIQIHKKLTRPRPDHISPRDSKAPDLRNLLPSNIAFSDRFNNNPNNIMDFDARGDNAGDEVLPEWVTYYARRRLKGGAGSFQDDQTWNGGEGGGDYYELVVPEHDYSITFWYRANRNHEISVNWGASFGGYKKTLNATTEWQLYTESRQGVLRGGGARGTALEFPDDGSDVEIDYTHLRILRDDEELLQYKPNVEALMYDGIPLREHGTIKADTFNAYDTELFFSDPREGFFGFWSAIDRCIAANGPPWFQIEICVPPDFWHDFLEVMCAPATPEYPRAMQRAARGHPEPYIDSYKWFIFEYGNESWNGYHTRSEFWNPPLNGMIDQATGETFGQASTFGTWIHYICRQMQKSEWWDVFRSKMIHIIGGHINSQYGENAYKYCSEFVELIGFADYTGGDFGNTSVSSEGIEGFYFILEKSFGENKRNKEKRIPTTTAICEEIGEVFGEDVRLAIYEAGPGYGFGLSDEEEAIAERVQKSRASGTATLLNMGKTTDLNLAIDNYFIFQSGGGYSAYQPEQHGLNEYPSYRLAMLFHQLIGKDGTRCREISYPATKEYAKAKGDYFIPDFKRQYVFCHESKTVPGKVMYIVCNADVPRSQFPTDDPLYDPDWNDVEPVSIATPLRPTAESKMTVVANIGPLWEHNRYAPGEVKNCVEINIDPVEMPVPNDLSRLDLDDAFGVPAGGLPGGNCVMILFENVEGVGGYQGTPVDGGGSTSDTTAPNVTIHGTSDTHNEVVVDWSTDEGGLWGYALVSPGMSVSGADVVAGNVGLIGAGGFSTSSGTGKSATVSLPSPDTDYEVVIAVEDGAGNVGVDRYAFKSDPAPAGDDEPVETTDTGAQIASDGTGSITITSEGQTYTINEDTAFANDTVIQLRSPTVSSTQPWTVTPGLYVSPYPIVVSYTWDDLTDSGQTGEVYNGPNPNDGLKVTETAITEAVSGKDNDRSETLTVVESTA